MERRCISGNDGRNIKTDGLQMIQTGRYKLGFTPVSMIIVFIVLSVYAAVAASHHAKPEYPMINRLKK